MFIYFTVQSVCAAAGILPVDSLEHKSYTYINDRINTYEKDSTKVWIYLNAYVRKAKKEQKFKEIVYGYQNCVYLSDNAVSIKYSDSLIFYAEKSADKILIGSAYLTRGIAYYKLRKYPETLDNYLTADRYLTETNDDYLKYKAKYNIALIKSYLGDYQEAMDLYKDCIEYFKRDGFNNTRGYLSAIGGLAFAYNRLGDYELSSKTAEWGIKESKRLEQYLDMQYIRQIEGINLYGKKQYANAIKLLQQSLPDIIKNDDFANQTVGYFYLGKSYMAINDVQKAMPFFYKVDSVFNKNNYIRPDLRENYEILINYYKQKNDKDKQLLYINTLLRADSILNTNYRYLSNKIKKQYDTKDLNLARQQIEYELSGAKNKMILYLILLAITTASLGYYIYMYYAKQRLYQKNYEKLLLSQKAPPLEVKEPLRPLDINKEVVDEILSKLRRFEEKELFLKKDLTQAKLADMLKTNSTYLSKVINNNGKTFTVYLNELRINYTIDLLTRKPIYRNYTIKALAELSGFSTAQNFSDAFFITTGIRPSYFISKLSKEYLKVS